MACLRRVLKGLGTSGTVTLEYALVLPALLMLTIGTMDVARLIWTSTTLARAAETAARCGAIDVVACPLDGLPAYAASEVWGVAGITAANFSASAAACGVQVVGTYTFRFVLPWPATTTLSPTACFPTHG